MSKLSQFSLNKFKELFMVLTGACFLFWLISSVLLGMNWSIGVYLLPLCGGMAILALANAGEGIKEVIKKLKQ